LSTGDTVKRAPDEEKEEEDTNNTLLRQEVSEEIETHQKRQSDEDLNAPKEQPLAGDDETGVIDALELLTISADVAQKDDEGAMTESAIVATKSEILADELTADSPPLGNEEEVADGSNRDDDGEEVEMREVATWILRRCSRDSSRGRWWGQSS
jgi:hypothetical protein